MKKFIFIYVLLMISCSEKKSVSRAAAVDEDVHAEYDTVPIDSFSPGATSAAVAAGMRQSVIRSTDSAAGLQKDEKETANKTDVTIRTETGPDMSASSEKTSQQNP